MEIMASQLFAGKIALVTGGGSGIGRAVCRLLAKDGARVIAADMNLKGVQDTVQMLVNPHNHIAVSMNVADKASVISGIKTAANTFKKPPTLLANAAGITKDNFLLKLDEKAFMDVLNVNVKGTFLVTQIMASALLEYEIYGGSIVNISSIVGKTGNIGQTNYAASKAAIYGLTKSSALELSRHGIRVNCVVPGFIDTPMVETVPEKVREKLMKLIPLKRLGQPDELAEVIAFLLSDKSSYMTGASVEVTGGLSM